MNKIVNIFKNKKTKLKIRNLKKNNGFTITEVLVTVVIIGILAISIFVVLDYIKIKSADARRITDIKKIEKALEVYYDKYAFYPANLDKLVSEGFLSFVPLPPSGAGQLTYTYVPLGKNKICTGYHLGASMQDKSLDNFKGDSDAYPGVPCEDAQTEDFDGTALYCKIGEIGEGIKNDTCLDIKR